MLFVPNCILTPNLFINICFRLFFLFVEVKVCVGEGSTSVNFVVEINGDARCGLDAGLCDVEYGNTRSYAYMGTSVVRFGHIEYG